MTGEEMERKIEFIVEQQVQFVTNMQRLEGNMQRLEQVQGKFESELQQLKEAALGTMSMIGTLGEFHKELTRSHKELAASHNILAKAQAETNKRLNAFIVVLEKHLTGNGAKGKRKKR